MTIQVFLTNRFDVVAEITGFETVEVIQRDLAVGSWRVRFDPATVPGIVELLDVNQTPWLGIEVVDTETGWRYGGKATRDSHFYQGNRTPRTIEVRGVDLMDDLAAVLQWPDTADYTRWWVESVGSQQLSVAVTNDLFFERGAGALPERQLTGLNIITPGTPFGPTKNYTSNGRPLLETWATWFRGTPYTLRMRLNRTQPGSAGEIRLEVAERATTTVLVTPELHHGEIEIRRTAATATHVIGMGELTGGADPNERFTSQARAAEANWLEGHRERFINRPLSNQAELDDAVTDELASSGSTRVAIADDVVIPEYGTNVLIGDYATVSVAPGEEGFLSPIHEVRLSGTPDGWRMRAAIGGADLSPAGLLDARLSSVASQVRRIEGEVR